MGGCSPLESTFLGYTVQWGQQISLYRSAEVWTSRETVVSGAGTWHNLEACSSFDLDSSYILVYIYSPK